MSEFILILHAIISEVWELLMEYEIQEISLQSFPKGKQSQLSFFTKYGKEDGIRLYLLHLLSLSI